MRICGRKSFKAVQQLDSIATDLMNLLGEFRPAAVFPRIRRGNR
jgi:hypothetical protein